MNEVMKQYPPRPTLTDEVREQAIRAWGARLEEMCCCTLDDKDAVIDAVIATARRYDDGYELGKKIEACGVDVSFELCEALDGVDSALRQAQDRLLKDWVAENGIIPPYPAGARVYWRDWCGRIMKGTVVENKRHEQYGYLSIAEDGDTSGGHYLVEFEDVELLEERGDE